MVYVYIKTWTIVIHYYNYYNTRCMNLFDPKFYSEMYEDLKGLTDLKLKRHYLKSGHREDRLPSAKYFETLYPTVDLPGYMKKHKVSVSAAMLQIHQRSIPPVYKSEESKFDAEYYMQQYPDIVAAGFNTPAKALTHWKLYGKKECRRPYPYQKLNSITEPSVPLDWQLTGDNLILTPGVIEDFGTHYFGWSGVMNGLYAELDVQKTNLKKYNHTIYFNSWLEKLTTWGKDRESDYQIMNTILDNDIKFITFTHNPPFHEWSSSYKRATPKTLNDLHSQIHSNKQNFNGLLIQHTNDTLISNNIYYESCDPKLLDKSIYIYTVSQEHKKYLTSPEMQKKYPFLKDKILSVNHPITDKINTRFNYNSYNKSTSKKIYHIGWWMRNLKTFNDVKTPRSIEKKVLVKNDFNCFTDIIKPAMNNVTFVSHLSDDEYIKVFEENILYMDPFDVTASNLLLECIRCETPVILRRHLAFEQYIGYSYPMFFDDPSDIEKLTTNQFNVLVKDANEYLKKMNKHHISQQTFNQKICYDLKKLEQHKTQTQLSWITSLHNADKYFDDYCKDFINQNSRYPLELELVMVNIQDSHSKETQQKIAQFGKKHPNVKIINIQKKNDPGLYKCWEIAIKNSTGKYITNANLDDKHNPDFSIKMIDYLENTPAVDITFAPVHASNKYMSVYDKSYMEALEPWFVGYEVGRPLHISDFWDNKSNNTHNPCHSTPVWRRDIHTIVGYFDEDSYGSIADYALWLKCVESNLNIACGYNEPLSYYYINNKSYGRVAITDTKKQNLLDVYNF